MFFRSRLALLLCLCLAVPAAVADEASAPPPPSPAQEAAARKKLNALETRSLPAIDQRLREARNRVAQDPQVQASYKTANEARQAQHHAYAASDELKAAKRVEAEAARAYRALIDQAMAQDPQAQALRNQAQALRLTLRELELEQRQSRATIEHYRNLMAGSPNPQVVTKREAQVAAAQAVKDAYNNDAAITTARKAHDQARQAYNDAVNALPERKTLHQAQRALREAESNSAALAAARQQAKLADDSLKQAIAQQLSGITRVASEQDRLKDTTAQHSASKADYDRTNAQLRDLRAKLEREADPAAAQARADYQAARQQAHNLSNQIAKPHRDAEHNARSAGDARLNELLAADRDATRIAAQKAEVTQQIRELRALIQRAEQARQPKPAE